MSDVRHIIARGKELTGRKLRQAIESATGTLIGGRGIRISTVNGHTTVSLKGHTPRAKAAGARLNVRIVEAFDQGDNKWMYDWAEAELQDDSSWSDKEGGRTSVLDPDVDPAFNKYEMLNTDTEIMGGVVIGSLPGDVELLSVPLGQVVSLEAIRRTDGTTGYWFMFTNGVQPSCQKPIGVLPPPPIRGLLA